MVRITTEDSAFTARIRELADWIVAQGGHASKRKIQNRFGRRFPTKRHVNRAVNALCDQFNFSVRTVGRSELVVRNREPSASGQGVRSQESADEADQDHPPADVLRFDGRRQPPKKADVPAWLEFPVESLDLTERCKNFLLARDLNSAGELYLLFDSRQRSAATIHHELCCGPALAREIEKALTLLEAAG